MRDKLAKHMKAGFLAFWSAIGTVWNFLFLKSQDPDETDFDDTGNEIRQDVIEI